MGWLPTVRRHPGGQPGVPPGVIEVKLHALNQLFNSMDPSPFNEKDLDSDAEAFIESWAMEYPAHAPLTLVVYLPPSELGDTVQPLIEEAVRNFFLRKATLARLDSKRMWKEGRWTLLIGALFLFFCLGLSQVVSRLGSGALPAVIAESLLIGGWVAMWRPLEFCLYGWWPQRHKARIYAKMGQMGVKIRSAETVPAAL